MDRLLFAEIFSQHIDELPLNCCMISKDNTVFGKPLSFLLISLVVHSFL